MESRRASRGQWPRNPSHSAIRRIFNWMRGRGLVKFLIRPHAISFIDMPNREFLGIIILLPLKMNIMIVRFRNFARNTADSNSDMDTAR
jgi:hypothetical protein